MKNWVACRARLILMYFEACLLYRTIAKWSICNSTHLHFLHSEGVKCGKCNPFYSETYSNKTNVININIKYTTLLKIYPENITWVLHSLQVFPCHSTLFFTTKYVITIKNTKNMQKFNMKVIQPNFFLQNNTNSLEIASRT